MKTYNVEIIETLCRVIEVKAADAENAVDQILKEHAEQVIILGADDYQSKMVRVIS